MNGRKPSAPAAAEETGQAQPAAVIVPMALEDIPRVVEIDHESFPLPWSYATYRYELLQNKYSYFFVAVQAQPVRAERTHRGWLADVFGWLGQAAPDSHNRSVVGYAGFWYIIDEAHISTIAVANNWRGQGVGELLFVAMLERALDLGATAATLEVRVSNERAQRLYRKYAFEVVGKRRRYYRDNGEDALLMTAVLHPGFRELMQHTHTRSAGRKGDQ
jgi:[ribosomal protein S18]-alanine N-acetyltransferase